MKPDYLRCLTLHGFKQLIGANCHDYPKVSHVYESDETQYGNTYGRGYTYTRIVKDLDRDDALDASIEADIRNMNYDMVIYPSYHRGMPLYDLVSSVYPPEKIVLMCGEDIHSCDRITWLERGHHVFVREL